MRIRPVHLAVAAVTALAAAASAGAAQASAPSAAGQPVGRYAAYQACQASMWRWTAEQAEHGTAVSAFRHRYRPQDVWREQHGWHVQVAGERGQQASTSNDVAFCVIDGTNARPRLVARVFPR